jgi:hypothetical protein
MVLGIHEDGRHLLGDTVRTFHLPVTQRSTSNQKPTSVSLRGLRTSSYRITQEILASLDFYSRGIASLILLKRVPGSDLQGENPQTPLYLGLNISMKQSVFLSDLLRPIYLSESLPLTL